MTIAKLERVMWRLRKRHPGRLRLPRKALKLAIMYECGTSPETYTRNRAALIALGWVTSDKNHIRLTDLDLNG